LKALITLEYCDVKIAESVCVAISPDNFKTPIGLKVKTTKENRKVKTEIRCDGKLATFIATIDDLLFSASTAEKTIQSIGKLK